ncbi:MAG TPA: ester cyclase [Bryobacteraceae bacterium]|nr:ester cyclase [Bryobacteraceae bacterium]
MSDENKALVHRWIKEVWNEGREQTIDELFAPDSIAEGIGETDQEVRGPEAFRQFYRNMRSLLPEVHIQVEDTVAEGDKVVARLTLEGTHTGSGMGTRGTGHRVKVRGVVILQITGGRIVHGWNYWDQLAFLRQIGAPAASPAPTVDRFLEHGR